MSPAPAHDVDALREKLRALGYLDAGVDRFLLAPAREGAGLWRLALASSLRIGLLAGVLLGLSGAVAAAIRVPGLVTGPRDAALVATGLAVLFGLAAALAACSGIVAAGRLAATSAAGPWFARRARWMPVAAGVLVGTVGLVYLVFWWRATGGQAPRGGVIATGLALLVSTAATVLLGYATSVAARAVLAVESETVPVAPIRLSLRGAAVVSAMVFGGGVAMLALTRPAPLPSAEPLVVVPTNVRLTVVAVDGFDPGVLRRQAAAPGSSWARLLAAPLARLAPVAGEPDPARFWTTVATGQPPERHGVAALEAREVAGLAGRLPASRTPVLRTVTNVLDLLRLTRPVISSGSERREKTFWEVASAAGLRTATVNWWATWPARPGDGLVVSERAALRFARTGPPAGEVAPASLDEALAARWLEVERRARARAEQSFADLRGTVAAALRRSAELDAIQVDLALSPPLAGTDLLTVYLPGLDIARHTLGSMPANTPAGTDLRADDLPGYYAFLDTLLGQLERAGPDRTLVLVGGPGRAGSGEGLLAIAWPGGTTGPPAGGGAPVAARLEDVAPTLLSALGVPVSRELPGRTLGELFPVAFAARHETRTVASYGRRDGAATPPARARELDEEMRERLRSLGYVQ
jgi:hypothetical protein